MVMPELRKILHRFASALHGLVPLRVTAATDRSRKTTRSADASAGEGVIPFAPLPAGTRRKSGSQGEGGAVILAFRPRIASEAALDEPPALTGSR